MYDVSKLGGMPQLWEPARKASWAQVLAKPVVSAPNAMANFPAVSEGGSHEEAESIVCEGGQHAEARCRGGDSADACEGGV